MADVSSRVRKLKRRPVKSKEGGDGAVVNVDGGACL